MKSKTFKTETFSVTTQRASDGVRGVERIYCALIILCLLSSAPVKTASAQDKPAQPQASDNSAQKGGKEYLGPTADSIRPYRPYNRDPFKKIPKVVKSAKIKQAQQAMMLGFPPVEVRRAEYRQMVDQARTRDLAEPEPVTQYLVSELDVMGVFRDERGYGAFVRAQPTGTTLFVRSGARCYNGEVTRIEGDAAETGGAKVTFKEISFMELNGKRTQQERMVMKAPAVPSKK
ncbi:MAG TPA: hypothetical protein VNI02_23490 [Blastocatellia bacterium]|jgi:hypothetical protein|nr:hypothetical protein [Blastocatellia bacterium]